MTSNDHRMIVIALAMASFMFQSTMATSIAVPAPIVNLVPYHKFEHIDLSYTLNNNTIHWLNFKDPLVTFNQKGRVAKNLTDSSIPPPSVNTTTTANATQNANSTYWLQSDRLELDLHTGTHIDAPVHFGEGKWSVDQIPLERMMNIPLAAVNVKNQCEKLRTYEITVNDILEYERRWNMKIPPNSLVLFYTGISNSWASGREAYYGTTGTDIRQGAIPGVSGDAAKFLVYNRSVVGVGIDSASIDNSIQITRYPIAHETFSMNNVYVIENVNTNLNRLIQYKPGYAYATLLPVAIERVSGTPIRLVATIDHARNEPSSNPVASVHAGVSLNNHYKSSASTSYFTPIISIIWVMLISTISSNFMRFV